MKRVLPAGATTIPAEAECVFSGIMFDVYHWPQKLFDGSTATFEMLKRPDTVQLIIIHEGKVVCQNEEQPNRPMQFRLPGGRVDPGEDWLTAAKRECLEETGLQCKNWKLIAARQPISKIEWFVATFVATEVESKTAPHLDPGEKIEPLLLTWEELQAQLGSPDNQKNPLLEYTRQTLSSFHSLADLESAAEFVGHEA